MRSCCRAGRRSGSTPPAGSWRAWPRWGAASRCARCGCRSCPAAILFDLGFPGTPRLVGGAALSPARPRGARACRPRFRARQCRGGARRQGGPAQGRHRQRLAAVWPTARWSERWSRSIAGARSCGRIAGGSGRPTRRWPASCRRSRRSPERPLDPEDFGLRAMRGRGQHDDRGGCDRRAARQDRLPAVRDHGAGRPGASDPPGAHAVRRRYGVRAVDRGGGREVDPARSGAARQCRGGLPGACDHARGGRGRAARRLSRAGGSYGAATGSGD